MNLGTNLIDKCKECNIHNVRDYIMNNLNHFDTDSECGWCIAVYGMRCILASYNELENDFEEFKEIYHEEMQRM